MIKRLNYYINISIIGWMFSFFFLFENSNSKMIVLVATSLITLILYKQSEKNTISTFHFKIDNFGKLVLTLSIAIVFAYFYHDASTREIRGYIIGLVLILLIPKDTIHDNHIKGLTLIASISSLLYVIYYHIYLDVGRSSWPINAIPHSTLTAIVLSLLLGFIIKKNIFNSYFLVSIIALTLSLLLNQTRGIWIASSVIILISTYLLIRNGSINIKKLSIIIPIVLIPISLISAPKITERLNKTKSELIQINSGDLSSSIGLRLQLWNSSLHIIKENPLLGIGNNFKPYLLDLYKKGLVSKSLIDFNPSHFHNQYIDILVKHGIVGLILFITLLFYPIYSYIALKSDNIESAFISILLAITSLTDVPFHNTEIIIFYITLQHLFISRNSQINQ